MTYRQRHVINFTVRTITITITRVQTRAFSPRELVIFWVFSTVLRVDG